MKLNKLLIVCSLVCGVFASCDLNEKFYSEVNPDTFYTNPEGVYSALRNPFRHWEYMYEGKNYWMLQEFTTDEMCNPARAADYYDNGDFVRLQYHEWTPEDAKIKAAYNQVNYIISHGLVSRDALSKVDYPAIGLTEKDKVDHLNQLDVLIASTYMKILDLFGGEPLYLSPYDNIKPRNSRQEIFDYIERTVKTALPQLHRRESLSEYQDGYITQGAAAFLLAQLYLNAESFIGKDMYAEAEVMLQDIYDGKYGMYRLDDTWYGPHTFTNNESPEAIWYVPSETAKLEMKAWYNQAFPYNAKDYFDCTAMGKCYNGFSLAPSLEKPGVPYTFKLGRPFEKFHPKDLRKKPYFYKGNGQYEGMFLFGLQKNPVTGKIVKGTKLKKGKNIELVDYVNITGGKSDMLAGDENSCIRLVKHPVPNDADQHLLWNADFPAMRFSEVVYNLAECKMRRGDIKGAAELINSVRKRNFENGQDPDPCTESNLDKYRLADEYMMEFVSEGHRRTDLIRWKMYTTETWWEHKPSDDTKNVFCLPSEALFANPLMKQNPGY